MAEPRTAPWNPDKRWADPMIALLLLLAVLTTFETIQTQGKPGAEAQRPGLQVRVKELQAAAQAQLHRVEPVKIPATTSGWDRAVLAILLAEAGDKAQGQHLAETSPQPFPGLWQGIYGDSPRPAASQIEALQGPLGRGYAYWQFQARLAERLALDPAPQRAQARAWALPRLVFLGLGSALLVVLGLIGAVTAGFLAFTPKRAPLAVQATNAMTWRAIALTFLGWFVALRFSGTAAALLFSVVPLPKVLALPVAYGFHVWVGTHLLLRAEGVTLKQAWGRMANGPLGRALGWAVAFLGLALLAVLLVGLLTQPLLRHARPPQQDLQNLVAGHRDLLSTCLLFLTLAGLAPLFEEWLFRGTLLPWLGQQFAQRWPRGGWTLAVMVSGLTFGAMHLQPAALPGLATLGLILCWAYLRTGNLWTTVAMHACWNGAVFALTWVLA